MRHLIRWHLQDYTLPATRTMKGPHGLISADNVLPDILPDTLMLDHVGLNDIDITHQRQWRLWQWYGVPISDKSTFYTRHTVSVNGTPRNRFFCKTVIFTATRLSSSIFCFRTYSSPCSPMVIFVLLSYFLNLEPNLPSLIDMYTLILCTHSTRTLHKWPAWLLIWRQYTQIII